MKRSPRLRRGGTAAVLLAVLFFLVTLPAAVALAQSVPDEPVRVGWFEQPGGAETHDGVYSGYHYDYLMEIAKHTGWTYTFVEADFSTCLELLQKGEIDLVGGLFQTEERARAFDFPNLEYGHSYTTLFTSAGSDIAPYDFERFDGMRIGVISDAVNKEYLAAFAGENGFAYEVAAFGSVEALTGAVADGRISAGLLGGYVAGADTRVLAEFAPMPYYFATTKGNERVLDGLNRAQNAIRIENPYLEMELHRKHLGEPNSHVLTAREQALVVLSQSTPITVGIIPSSAPACYWDEERGEYTGIFMEVLKAVSQRTGLQFAFEPIDLARNSPIGWLKQGSPELVAGVLKTQRFRNDPELILSDKLLDDSLVVVGRRGDDFTQNAEQKRIALPSGFQAAFEYVAEQFPEHRVVEYPNIEACLNAVEAEQADATLYMRSCVSYFLQNPHYESLGIIPAFTIEADTCVAGLSADKETLLAIVDKGLAMIDESERNGIMMNFTIMHPYRMTTGDVLYKYRMSFTIILALLLAVIAVLLRSNAVKRKNEVRMQAAYRLEQEAREQEQAALTLAKKASAAKSSFMSRMSHEIRTPLNAVIGYNTIAKNELAAARNEPERKRADMKVMDCLTKSEMASKHLLTVINDVLDMSAVESGRIQVAHERFDFKKVISSITGIFYTQARGKGVSFETVFDTPTEEWFVGDQMRVNQILTNLLSNAVKFTPNGGSVRLSIRQLAADAETARLEFCVADTGIGMDEAYLAHIWTPFEQADSTISRRFGGTGLGLSITKSLVDLMGGAIAVTSAPGVGSTFCVELTFARTKQSEADELYDFSDINALVVDNEAGACDYVRLLFTRCGARCKTVTSGADAVEAFYAAARSNDPFTACLVDWHMPEMNGIETIKRIRSLAGETIPMIIVTAYDFSEIADEAQSAGVSRFVSKPLFQSTLFDLLANISGRPIPSMAENRTAYDFTGFRALLAEDNAMNMEVAKRVLNSAGLTVDGVYNGREAVERFLSAEPGTYQAILMDVQMPEMDGHQATRAIRASAHPEAQTIPIIAMTADAFAENVAEALACGMNDHVAKPIDIEGLFATLQKYF